MARAFIQDEISEEMVAFLETRMREIAREEIVAAQMSQKQRLLEVAEASTARRTIRGYRERD
jgi:hypothetical protein